MRNSLRQLRVATTPPARRSANVWPPPWACRRTIFPGDTRSRYSTCAATARNADARLDHCAGRRARMSTWSRDELRRIADADDLHISALREDGVTYGTPTWIWSVAVDDALYVRAYNGQNSRWYQAALRQKAGRITAAGMTKEVMFEPVQGSINDRIDDAYRAKIGRASCRE